MNRIVLLGLAGLLLIGCGGHKTYFRKEGYVYHYPPEQELAMCEAEAQKMIHGSRSPFTEALMVNGTIGRCMEGKGYVAR